MKFTIVGAGAIGGYLGTRLALAGEDVTFIARRRNLEAINAEGFRLVLEDGTQEHARNVRAVERMAEAGPQDVVLLTLKAHQLREVVAELPALYGPDTVVVSMVNGVPWWYFHALGGPHEGRAVTRVDPDGAIARAIPPERVIGSVVYPAAELVAPGLVKLVEGNRFTVGEPSNERTPRVEALSQALMKAGFKAPVSRDIRSELWIKLWGNLSFNPISALTHATLEGICRFAPTRELARRMMAEGQSVAEALGVRFKITLEQRLAGAEAVGAHKTSMLQDVEAGRALELEALVGAVIELGQIAGVATPTIEAVYAATKLLEHSVLQARGRLAIQPG
ncbi:MAG: 2-dehydropantoate 2-reductase [Burkholderiaceae bacterium]|jgi:2-dehydropantoate 2-reductase|nr:2-dehydropantoate 2-reductase [Burkholderiaceae bacterium]MCZ8176790.1 2-dehydropantoate 2-reductase [Burkholderiaceae bacterium]